MSKNSRRSYKFSFVIPVYNVEAYIAETLESVISQTMNFEKNIEIILVNDGSPDNSEKVCLKYKEQYPDNITYITQKNSGPSVARNRGISMARGKYISLLDSDDLLSRDTLATVYDFFEKHQDEIDVVSIKQMFFEARNGEHPLNYKFTSDRVIDLSKNFDDIQMSAPSSFFKTEVLQKHHFDESVGRYAEDCKLMGEVLLDKQKFGVVQKPVYWYRKRNDAASSLNAALTDRFWYMETPQRSFGDLMKRAERKLGHIPKFIQFMTMYDFQWRLKQRKQTVLNDEDQQIYKESIYQLLKSIDDDVIMAQKQLPIVYKLFAVSKKHGEKASIESKITIHSDEVYYRKTALGGFRPLLRPAQHPVHIELIDTTDDAVVVYCGYHGVVPMSTTLIAKRNGKKYKTTALQRPEKTIYFFGDIVSEHHSFYFSIPKRDVADIKFYLSVGESQDMLLPISARRIARLNPQTSRSYRVINDTIVSKSTESLSFYPHTYWQQVRQELRYTTSMVRSAQSKVRADLKKSYLGGKRWIVVPSRQLAKILYVLFVRAVYFTFRLFQQRKIWIVSDRLKAADDNGEVFFRYLMEQQELPVKVYFAIGKNTADYNRIKQYGPVLNYHSFRYKLLSLLADKIISSEAVEYVENPFGGRMSHLIDLCRHDFVFLQHGIIRDDISSWLNKFNKNIKLFITSAKPEYNSIIDGDYYYDATVVKLTGLARYDNLKNTPKNKLILAPTWRANLVGSLDQETGSRKYNAEFRQSDFYRFYQGLMEDKRIREALREHNLKGELYLHPSLEAQTKDFNENSDFFIKRMPHDYPKMKREGNLLVTDYSSVAFDFAYLGKPIIYTQFDDDTYYESGVSSRGYLSYEKDGLGPVVYDYENAVREIVKSIKNDCTMEQKYKKRLDEFFTYRDTNNSQRIFEAIKRM